MKRTIFILILALSFPLYAQGTPAQKPTEEPARATYLDRQIALRNVDVVKTESLRDIHRLTVLVANFGAEVPGSDQDLKKIEEMYTSANARYFRRQFIESYQGHLDCRKAISDLFKKFCDKFREKAASLVNQVSDSLSGIELKDKQNAARSSQHNYFRSQVKLNIAFHQLSEADDFIDDRRYGDAIDHLRLAKAFAIRALLELEEDASKKAQMETAFKVDLDDSQGYPSGSRSHPAPAQTPSNP